MILHQLKNLNTGILGGLSESGLLLVAEVGWDSNDGGVNRVTGEIGGGGNKSLNKTGGGVLNGNGGWLALLLILNGESNGAVNLLWVCGGVAVGWIYRLEVLANEVSEVCDGVVLVADKLCLCLVTNVLLTVNVRDDRWDLTI